MLKRLIANTRDFLKVYFANISPKPVKSSSTSDDGTAAGSPHYNQLERQPIIEMLETLSADEFQGYLKGNVIKYTRRVGLKKGTNDQAKADQYSTWLQQFMGNLGIVLNGKFYTKE